MHPTRPNGMTDVEEEKKKKEQIYLGDDETKTCLMHICEINSFDIIWILTH